MHTAPETKHKIQQVRVLTLPCVLACMTSCFICGDDVDVAVDESIVHLGLYAGGPVGAGVGGMWV